MPRRLPPVLRLLRRGTAIGLALGLMALAAAQPPADGDEPRGTKIFEEWSLLLLDGKRCGYDSTIVTRSDDPSGPRYLTVQQEDFVVRRLGHDLSLLETSKVTEDAEGGVLSFEERTQGAGSNIVSEGHREGDELVVSCRGQTQRYDIPRLAALGPEAVRRLSDAVPLEPGRTFSFATFESDYPQAPVIESGRVVGPDVRKIRGEARSVWRLTTETSLMRGLASTTWVDAQGNDVESIVNIPGIGHLDEIVSSRADCMQQPEGAEIFASTLLRPQKAIPEPRAQAQAVYRLFSANAKQPLTLWNEGEQRVLESRPGRVEISVTAPELTAADAGYSLPHAETPELEPYLHASAYLESDAPLIRKLAREAVGNEKNPVLAAGRIERFVRAYITKKDLNIGFASAEETAVAREGDCTEHAVLCAALGRAVGMPTRCVLGFGYIPPGVNEPTISNAVDKDTGIFGFHMWAEGMIAPDRWMAMDAALDGFDVGHIAILKTALEEVNPLVDLNMPILQMMEKLRIKVVKTMPKPGVAAPGID